MPSAINNAEVFLILTLFSLLIFLFLIRFILASVRANYFNPFTIVIDKLTKPIVAPLKRIIPSYKNFETVSIVIALVLEIIKFYLLFLVQMGVPNIEGVIVLSFADILKNIINIYFFSILIQAILSWVNASYSPLGEVIAKITWPLMKHVRRVIPPIGGLDISPIPAMLVLQLLLILCIAPLMDYGNMLALSS